MIIFQTYYVDDGHNYLIDNWNITHGYISLLRNYILMCMINQTTKVGGIWVSCLDYFFVRYIHKTVGTVDIFNLGLAYHYLIGIIIKYMDSTIKAIVTIKTGTYYEKKNILR